MCEAHPSAWIAACDKLGIDIMAKGAQNTVQKYQKQHNQVVSSAADPEDLQKCFMPEALVDAIVDFIVSNDQVLVKSSSVFILLVYILCSPSYKPSF